LREKRDTALGNGARTTPVPYGTLSSLHTPNAIPAVFASLSTPLHPHATPQEF